MGKSTTAELEKARRALLLTLEEMTLAGAFPTANAMRKAMARGDIEETAKAALLFGTEVGRALEKLGTDAAAGRAFAKRMANARVKAAAKRKVAAGWRVWAQRYANALWDRNIDFSATWVSGRVLNKLILEGRIQDGKLTAKTIAGAIRKPARRKKTARGF